MPRIPLAVTLKKQVHKTTAQAQDILVSEVYSAVPKAILHGGTAIWRCYQGTRFSEDVDFYHLPLDSATLKSLLKGLERKGLEAQKAKRTSNALFAKFSYEGAVVRYEAVYKRVKNEVLRPYELFDGNYAMVRTLTPEALIMEKVAAYAARGKVRDLYDIVHLLPAVSDEGSVRPALKTLLAEFHPPQDAGVLKAVIISGPVPTVGEMKEALENWAK